MARQLNSYTVDFQHRRVTVRPADGPEYRIDRKSLIEKMRPEAEKQVDKHVDVEKETRADIEQRQAQLKRTMAQLKIGSPEHAAAKQELEQLASVDMKKAVPLQRNRLISERAIRLGEEALNDLLVGLYPKGI